MSLLWKHAAAFQVAGMAWNNSNPQDKAHYTPIHVKQAGFAGLVGDSEDDAEGAGHFNEGDEGDEHFDEDLYDEAAPEPTAEEHAHNEEHGEMPESYHKRYDNAYAQAVQKKKAESIPDIEDPELRHFTGEHGSNTKLWHERGRSGKINLRQPVYATQSHVAREHIAKYMAKPNATSHHRTMYGATAGGDYLGEEHPMFVTHEGRLHVIEGHHRVAAELARGSAHMYGHHFNLDEHPQYGNGEINDGDEDD
jgi:hypothetical protein